MASCFQLFKLLLSVNVVKIGQRGHSRLSNLTTIEQYLTDRQSGIYKAVAYYKVAVVKIVVVVVLVCLTSHLTKKIPSRTPKVQERKIPIH